MRTLRGNEDSGDWEGKGTKGPDGRGVGLGAAALGTASVSFITAGTVMEDKGPLPYPCPPSP